MLLAEEVLAETAEKATGIFSMFDVFIIAFTIILAIGLLRQLKAKERNMFALGFNTIAFLAFLGVDGLMVLAWTGQIHSFQDMIFGG